MLLRTGRGAPVRARPPPRGAAGRAGGAGREHKVKRDREGLLTGNVLLEVRSLVILRREELPDAEDDVKRNVRAAAGAQPAWTWKIFF